MMYIANEKGCDSMDKINITKELQKATTNATQYNYSVREAKAAILSKHWKAFLEHAHTSEAHFAKEHGLIQAVLNRSIRTGAIKFLDFVYYLGILGFKVEIKDVKDKTALKLNKQLRVTFIAACEAAQKEPSQIINKLMVDYIHKNMQIIDIDED